KGDGKKKDEGGGGGGGGSGSGGGGGDMHSLAELILVKLMQEDVTARTKELDEAGRKGTRTPAEEAEYKRLGDEQGKLADLILDLIGEAKKSSDESPLEIKPEDLKLEQK